MLSIALPMTISLLFIALFSYGAVHRGDSCNSFYGVSKTKPSDDRAIFDLALQVAEHKGFGDIWTTFRYNFDTRIAIAPKDFGSDSENNFMIVPQMGRPISPLIIFRNKKAIKADSGVAMLKMNEWIVSQIDKEVSAYPLHLQKLGKTILLYGETPMSARVTMARSLAQSGLQVKTDTDVEGGVELYPNPNQPVLAVRPDALEYNGKSVANQIINKLSGLGKTRSQYKLIDQYLSTPDSNHGLSEAHRRFLSEGGIIEFVNPPEPKGRAYFESPPTHSAAPKIVLQSFSDLTNGTYKHELTHFRDWLSVKKKLISLGRSGKESHTAVHRAETQNPEERWTNNARSTLWLETHAVEQNSPYPEFESIRRLTMASNFVKNLREIESPIRTEVTRLLRSAQSKVILQDVEFYTNSLQKKTIKRNGIELAQGFLEKNDEYIARLQAASERDQKFYLEGIRDAAQTFFRLIGGFETALKFDVMFQDWLDRIPDQIIHDEIKALYEPNFYGKENTPPKQRTEFENHARFIEVKEALEYRKSLRNALRDRGLPSKLIDAILD